VIKVDAIGIAVVERLRPMTVLLNAEGVRKDETPRLLMLLTDKEEMDAPENVDVFRY